MKNKKAQTTTTLVLVIAAMIALVVFLFAHQKFVKILKPEPTACPWSIVASALTKQLAFGKEILPPECSAELITIKKEDLEKNFDYAKKRIEEYIKKPEIYEKTKILEYFNDPKDEKQLYMFAMHKIFADNLKNCWSKVLKGAVPIFDEWWKFFGLGGKDPEMQYVKGETKSIFGVDLFTVYGPPTNCIVCSRIAITKEVDDLFDKKDEKNLMNSFNIWLQSNPIPMDPKLRSYYEFIIDGQSSAASAFTLPFYYYRVNVSEPWAVVFARINPLKGAQIATDAFNYLAIPIALKFGLGKLGLRGRLGTFFTVGYFLGESVGVLPKLEELPIVGEFFKTLIKDATPGPETPLNFLHLIPYEKIIKPYGGGKDLNDTNAQIDPEAGNCAVVID